MVHIINHPSENLHSDFQIGTVTLILPDDVYLDLIKYMQIFKLKFGTISAALSTNDIATVISYIKTDLFSSKANNFCIKILDVICNKSGYVIIKNFPYEFSPEDNEIAYLLFNCYLGNPTSNNRDGILVWHVIPKQIQSTKTESTNERHGNSGISLNFHTDTSTFSGLLCIKQAPIGGENELISTVAVHNIIYKKNKELLKILYSPFYIDRRGEQLENQEPYAQIPIFGISKSGKLKTHWAKPYLYAAYDKYNLPPLTNSQNEALELLIATINDVAKTTKLVTKSDPGTMIIMNNNLIFHNRREFHGDRCLFRIWLYSKQYETFPHMFGYSYTEDVDISTSVE